MSMPRALAAFVVLTLIFSLQPSAHSQTVSQIGQLFGSGVQPSDLFGASVAISGDGRTIAVGAPQGNGTAGSIYVYQKPSTGWGTMTETAHLAPTSQCNLGSPIAISFDGRVIISGAGACSGGGFLGIGWIDVFVRPSSGWQNTTQSTTVLSVNSNGMTNEMGLYVSIAPRGNLIVGSGEFPSPDKSFAVVYNSNLWNNITDPSSGAFTGDAGISPVAVWANPEFAAIDTVHGSVLFYVPAQGGFRKAATLTASDGATLFNAIVMDGDTIVAGSLGPSDNQGAAYVFSRPPTGWVDATETAKLTAPGLSSTAMLGSALSLSGYINSNALIVGGSGTSAAYVFTKPSGGWVSSTPTATLLSSDPDQQRFGAAVSISGATMVVGDPGEGPGGSQNGAAYIFQAH